MFSFCGRASASLAAAGDRSNGFISVEVRVFILYQTTICVIYILILRAVNDDFCQGLELSTGSVAKRNACTFIMDELSVFHYRKEVDDRTGNASFHLILLNFWNSQQAI